MPTGVPVIVGDEIVGDVSVLLASVCEYVVPTTAPVAPCAAVAPVCESNVVVVGAPTCAAVTLCGLLVLPVCAVRLALVAMPVCALVTISCDRLPLIVRAVLAVPAVISALVISV